MQKEKLEILKILLTSEGKNLNSDIFLLIEEEGKIHHYSDSSKCSNIFGLCLKRS